MPTKPDAFSRKSIFKILRAARFHIEGHAESTLEWGTALVFKFLHTNFGLSASATGDETVRAIQRLSENDLRRLRHVCLADLFEPSSPVPLR